MSFETRNGTRGRRQRRLGMAFDHEAEIEDMGMVFQAVVYVITGEQWRSGAAARL
jgi:hypothetical protein